jgi:hypothetical protein
VITLVCESAGAVLKQDMFSCVVDAGKLDSAHKGGYNMISALIKYGIGKKQFVGFTDDALRYAAIKSTWIPSCFDAFNTRFQTFPTKVFGFLILVPTGSQV